MPLFNNSLSHQKGSCISYTGKKQHLAQNAKLQNAIQARSTKSAL